MHLIDCVISFVRVSVPPFFSTDWHKISSGW